MVLRNWRVSPVALLNYRRLYTSTGSGPLRIIFFGRDEFSCATFEELHKAQGKRFSRD